MTDSFSFIIYNPEIDEIMVMEVMPITFIKMFIMNGYELEFPWVYIGEV